MMSMRALKIRPALWATAVAVLVALSAGFVVAPARTDLSDVGAEVGSPSMAPLRLSLSIGQELAHDLDLALRVLVDADKQGSQARTVSVKGTLLTRVTSKSDTGWELALLLRQPEVEGFAHQGETVKASLGLPVRVFLGKDGAFDTSQTLADVPAEVRQIWMGLFSMGEVVLPTDPSSTQWELSVDAQAGFPIQRRIVHERSARAPLFILRSVHHALAPDAVQLDGVSASVTQEASGGTLVWHRRGAWLSSFSAFEAFEITLSTGGAESQSFHVSRSLELTAVGHSPSATAWWLERPDWRRIEALLESQSDEASETANLLKMPLAEALLAASQVMEQTNAGHAVQWLTRYLLVHPEMLPELESKVRRGEPDKYTQGLVVGSVTNLGTPESLEFLENILTDAEAPTAARMASAIAMKHVPSPDEGMVEVLQEASEGVDDAAIANSALLSLGALASDRSGLEADRKGEILHSLEGRLSERSPRAVSPVLGALANSGKPEAVRLIAPYTRSAHANVAASAYQALGYAGALPPPGDLISDLRREKHYVVSGAIAQELARHRGLSGEDLVAAGELLVDMPEHTLTRRYLVQLLGAHAQGSASARDHLRRHAELETDSALKSLSVSLTPAG